MKCTSFFGVLGERTKFSLSRPWLVHIMNILFSIQATAQIENKMFSIQAIAQIEKAVWYTSNWKILLPYVPALGVGSDWEKLFSIQDMAQIENILFFIQDMAQLENILFFIRPWFRERKKFSIRAKGLGWLGQRTVLYPRPLLYKDRRDLEKSRKFSRNCDIFRDLVS